jgi:branched-chain amino acid transport system permease protein
VSEFLALLLAGIAQGAIVALVAVGFLILFNATRVINFAHGDLMSLAAFIAIAVINLGVPILLAYAIALVAMAFVGVAIERLAYAPLRNRPPNVFLIVTLGLSVAIEAGEVLWFGIEPSGLPTPFGDGAFHFGGAAIAYQRVAIIGIATVLVLGTLYIFYRTQFGRETRALADNREVAMLLGVPVRRIGTLAFVVSSVLAGAAGLLIAPLSQVDETFGFSVLLVAFASGILVGFGSLWATALGALAMGIVQELVAGYLLPGYSDVLPLVIILVVIIFRPRGVLGLARHARF